MMYRLYVRMSDKWKLLVALMSEPQVYHGGREIIDLKAHLFQRCFQLACIVICESNQFGDCAASLGICLFLRIIGYVHILP